MNTDEIKIAILRIEGTNNEEETCHAFHALGAKPEIIHLKQLTHADVKEDEKRNLFDYHCLFLPGGFSAGDYIRAGAIFAARMKSHLKNDLIEFVKNGYPVGGICNGFQILVELGLLPSFGELMSNSPTAALSINDSSKFECRPVLLKMSNKGKCVFTKNISKGKILRMVVAHAEGKFVLPLSKEKELLQKLIDNDQIVFRYVDDNGQFAGYPWNPNGSLYNIAGICNPQGNVFGMMPHPERVFYSHTHQDRSFKDQRSIEGDGRMIFESVLDYIKKTL